ncbi:MAG: hypothetical protein GY756_20890, partial [bacterium]|nr:hypothetical protein [bacterium]
NTVMHTYLGVDSKSILKIATSDINALLKEAFEKLSLFKTLINVNFPDNKDRKDWILKTLGLATSFKKLRKGSQENVIQLLVKFTENMTPELKAEIVARGTAEDIIDSITGMSNSIIEADIAQERLKDTGKSDTEEAIKAFNAIYEQAIGICKVGQKLFKNDKLKSAQFSFSHIMSNMRGTKKTSSGEEAVSDDEVVS